MLFLGYALSSKLMLTSSLSFLFLWFPFIVFLVSYRLSLLWNRVLLTFQESEKNCLKRLPHEHQHTTLVWQENRKDFFNFYSSTWAGRIEILEFDWVITRTWPVQLFTIRPTGRVFFPLISLLKVSGSRQCFASFTLPSTKSQHRFIAVYFKMARKVTVSKFNWLFEVVRVCLIVCNRGAVMAGNPVFLSP